MNLEIEIKKEQEDLNILTFVVELMTSMMMKETAEHLKTLDPAVHSINSEKPLPEDASQTDRS